VWQPCELLYTCYLLTYFGPRFCVLPHFWLPSACFGGYSPADVDAARLGLRRSTPSPRPVYESSFWASQELYETAPSRGQFGNQRVQAI